MQDNEEFLAQNKKQGYKDANSNKEVFKVWSDIYAKEVEKSGIFEDEIAIYNITKLKPKLENLKPMSQSEIQKKRHEWATILRANAVGDRSLALNGLMNLFLCKITDELENTNDLQFSWRGNMQDSAFDLVDRLQKLYKTGMEKYLKQKITYVSKNDIDKAFGASIKAISPRKAIYEIFTRLKYFSNGDFNFIEVYNKELFYKNFKILLPIVLKLEDTAFTKNADSNILGDYFESYIHDMPQQEGQYFTPVPLVNFIIHSLPVLKDSKVLDFSCGAGHFLTQYAEINKPYQKAKFLGQDKDPRLAKIAKIASFMHQTKMEILANDSLECGIEDSSFNVLISNPPYSVDGFLNVLSDETRRSYELFNDNLNIESNDTIQCFFIEKASKALQSNGLLSLVLPNTILENDKGIPLNKPTREILLRDFYIIAICELGSATFFKTNTSPIVLFALRKQKNTRAQTTQNNDYEDFCAHILQNDIAYLKEDSNTFLPLIHSYCAFRAYDRDEFLALLELNLQEDSTLYQNELFKEYTNAYNALIQKEKDEYNKKSTKHKAANPFTPSQSKQEFIRELEAQKFLYFCYSLDSTPLIIKAPSDTKEQKKFLGYAWSSSKGKEGIQYITTSGINAISEILTPLYNPKNRFDSSKISFYIMQEYLNKLDVKSLDNHFQKDITKEQEAQQELESYIKQKRLIDMLDFDEVDFRKRIKPTQKVKIISLWKSDIEQIALAECGEFIGGLWTGKKPPFIKAKVIRNTNFSLKGTLKLDSEYPELEVEKSQFEKRKLEYGDIIIEKSGGSSTQAVGRVVIFTFQTNEPYSFSNFTTRLRVTRDDINPFFLHLVLHYIYQQGITFAMQGGMSGIRNLDMNLYKRLKIPKPDIKIQTQIVEECEKSRRAV
ncbi:N-6 DNA methylase [Helicobacter winghamensis]